MNTYMNMTRSIALSAIVAVMGLASTDAAANSGAFPTSDPYSRDSQLARTTPGEFKPSATKEGEVMYSNPGHPVDKVYRGGKWVAFNSKEDRKAANAPSAPSAQTPASAGFKSISPKEGEIMNFPLSGRSAIHKNGQWVNLP